PNQANATSFDVKFDYLTAPANSVGVTFPPDTTAPSVVSVSADCMSNVVTVTFSERMESVLATTVANYQISGGVVILSVALSADGRTVTLFTSPLSASYVLTVANLTDLAGNPLPNTSKSFQCSSADCCANCNPSQFVTNKIAVPAGTSYFVNPLCNGTN